MLKEEHDGNLTAALLRGILIPRARRERCTARYTTLVTCLRGTKGNGNTGKKVKATRKARARKTTVKRKESLGLVYQRVWVLWQVGTQESLVLEVAEGCNSSSSCNSESNPLIWRERRLTVDIRRECIELAKRTNPG